MFPVIRAIDVGYSWTKYVVEGSRVDAIRCRAFPSVAPRASGRDLALDGLTQRQTVPIAIDGVVFEVGPEAVLVQDVVQALPHDNRYIHTPEYLALVRGALRLMHVDHVDLLVVGLPVALFGPQREALAARLLGSHDLGTGAPLAVRAVRVLAQPVGRALLGGDRAPVAPAPAALEAPARGRRLADARLGGHEWRADPRQAHRLGREEPL